MTREPSPVVRMALGATAVTAISASIRADRISGAEARVFRSINNLPDDLHPALWTIMQMGTIGAAPVAAAVARAAGDRRLATRLLVGGTATWGLAKAVKRMIGRPRPADLVPGTRIRGQEAAGLGYLSGHAGVATALGVATLPKLGPAGRLAVRLAVPVVSLARIYVGAHLPLDVAGGAALGLVVDAVTEMCQDGALSGLNR